MVSKKVLIAGLAVLALLGAGAAVAAESVTTNAQASADAQAAGPSPQRDPRACNRDHGGCPSWARFRENGSAVEGRNVEFQYDAATGAIADYTVRGPMSDDVIFTSIDVAGYNASASQHRVRGPMFVERDAPDVGLVVFDAPNAAFFLGTKSGNTVTLVVGAGITATAHAKDAGWSPAGALLVKGDHKAKIVLHGDGDVSVANGTITIHLGAKSWISFRVEGYPHAFAKQTRAMKEMREKGARKEKAGKKEKPAKAKPSA